MLLYKKKNSNQQQQQVGRRFLISITVVGSAGPIRFVVNEDDLVASVIDTALKSYARQGRLPILGSSSSSSSSHPTSFILYSPLSPPGTDEALHPWKTIGSVGVRNFMLFKNPTEADNRGIIDHCDKKAASVMSRKLGAGRWRAWFHRSLTLKISSH